MLHISSQIGKLEKRIFAGIQAALRKAGYISHICAPWDAALDWASQRNRECVSIGFGDASCEGDEYVTLEIQVYQQTGYHDDPQKARIAELVAMTRAIFAPSGNAGNTPPEIRVEDYDLDGVAPVSFGGIEVVDDFNVNGDRYSFSLSRKAL